MIFLNFQIVNLNQSIDLFICHCVNILYLKIQLAQIQFEFIRCNKFRKKYFLFVFFLTALKKNPDVFCNEVNSGKGG